MTTAPPAATPRLPRVLRSESGRYYLAFLLATAVSLLSQLLVPADGPYDRVALSLVVLPAALLAYSGLTVLAFGVDFAGRRTESTLRRGVWWRRWLQAGAGAEVAVTFSALALLAAVGLAATDVSSTSVGFTAVTAAVVVSAWVTVVVAYAADYARRDCAAGGLEWPGEAPRGFGDYLYFSAAVSTTFGTTDVTVTAAAVRRVVLGHALLAFAFNTVVLAMLVSALLG